MVYGLGVTAGSLATSVFSPGAFLAGSSGGVYALASAHLGALLLNWKEDSLIIRQRMRKKKATSPTFGNVVRIGQLLVVGGILSVDVLMAVSKSLNGEAYNTSLIPHMSGVVMGLLVGVVILKNRRVQFWEQWLRVACCALAAVFLVVMIVINICIQSIFMPADYEERECLQYGEE